MKEKMFKKGITRRLFSVVLALMMAFSLLPMGAFVAHAEELYVELDTYDNNMEKTKFIQSPISIVLLV